MMLRRLISKPNGYFRRNLSSNSSKSNDPSPFLNPTAKKEEKGSALLLLMLGVALAAIPIDIIVFDNWSPEYEKSPFAPIYRLACNAGYALRKTEVFDKIITPKRPLENPLGSNSNPTKKDSLSNKIISKEKIVSVPIVEEKKETEKKWVPETSAQLSNDNNSSKSTNKDTTPAAQSVIPEVVNIESSINSDPEKTTSEDSSKDMEEISTLEHLLEEVIAEGEISPSDKVPVTEQITIQSDAAVTVTSIASSSQATPDELSAVVPTSADKLLAASTHLAVESSATLKRDMHATLLHDLGALSKEELKVKVSQLAAELFERSRWEGVRLQQSLRRVETEITQQYREKLEHQRKEIEKETTSALQQMEHDVVVRSADQSSKAILMFETQLAEAMREQALQFEAKRRTELDNQTQLIKAENDAKINAEVARLEADHSQRVLATGHDIGALTGTISHLNQNLSDRMEQNSKSKAILNQINAVHALEHTVSASKFSALPVPINASLESVKQAYPGDAFVNSVLNAIPTAAKKDGILSEHSLNARFLVLRDEMRKVALAPPTSSSMLGHVVGTILAAMSSVPKTPVAGSGVEETLSRVTHCMDQGRLSEALKEMESVTGYAGKMSADWVHLMQNRLSAESAVEALRVYSILSQHAQAK